MTTRTGLEWVINRQDLILIDGGIIYGPAIHALKKEERKEDYNINIARKDYEILRPILAKDDVRTSEFHLKKIEEKLKLLEEKKDRLGGLVVDIKMVCNLLRHRGTYNIDVDKDLEAAFQNMLVVAVKGAFEYDYGHNTYTNQEVDEKYLSLLRMAFLRSLTYNQGTFILTRDNIKGMAARMLILHINEYFLKFLGRPKITEKNFVSVYKFDAKSLGDLSRTDILVVETNEKFERERFKPLRKIEFDKALESILRVKSRASGGI